MADTLAPSWLDAALVQKALRGGGDAGAAVTSMALSAFGAAGDNYVSVMYRIAAETSSGTKSLIVKTLPTGDVMLKAAKEASVFATESLLLSDIVPKMQKILEDAAPGRFTPFAAKCPHHGTEPEDFIFLEDLGQQGFRMADRQRGLGLRHALLALRALARFHAASVALLAQDPTIPHKLPNPFISMKQPFEAFVSSGWQLAVEACREWPDFPSKYTNAIEAGRGSAMEKYTFINDYRPGRFNVIGHGDFWINNMMFGYKDGVAFDIRFVDFQFSRVTSPAVDLQYFMNSSLRQDVYVGHYDLLIREYHVALVETMELLGFQAPTLKELLEDIDENGFYSTFGSILVYPIIRCEKVPDIEKSLSNLEKASDNKFIYSTTAMKNWLLCILPEYIRKGWL